jgi:hypothetical protein
MNNRSIVLQSTSELNEVRQNQISDEFERAIQQTALEMRGVQRPRPKMVGLNVEWLLPVPQGWFRAAEPCDLEVRVTRKSILAILTK